MIPQTLPEGVLVIISSTGISISQTGQAGSAESPKKPPNKVKKILKEESRVLGVLQILIGLILLFLGGILASVSVHPDLQPLLRYPFLGAMLFIISGSLSVAAERKPTKLLGQGSLGMNAISALAAATGFLILTINMAKIASNPDLCLHSFSHHPFASGHFDYDEPDQTEETVTATVKTEITEPERHLLVQHYDYFPHFILTFLDEMCFLANSSLNRIKSMMLILTILEFCIAAFLTCIIWKASDFRYNKRMIFQAQSQGINSCGLRTARLESDYEELVTT
ncbi:membrane-spanning 4-domains subfamily A member 6A-like [Ornithorhynchus anatinus]|uniref:Membrane spanning 4-domains A6A n=1 Tax=Ornithorhynchus anatinus TaxID=9258 RepID=K7EGU8_ORNAN|nr:membrane-spanning 4-domains subfamily A member 6A-like [Ornithorhynchus anatinus]XP_007668798.1 membrane-spanning 4-domains subfamily A member 6A-like [Ornithorhynchus anatinus]